MRSVRSVRSCARAWVRPTVTHWRVCTSHGTPYAWRGCVLDHESLTCLVAWFDLSGLRIPREMGPRRAGLCPPFIGDGPGYLRVSVALPGGCCVCACMAAGASVVLFSCSVFACATRHGFSHRHAALFVFTWTNKRDDQASLICFLHSFIGPALCTVL